MRELAKKRKALHSIYILNIQGGIIMKKFLLSILFVSFLAILAACGGEAESESASEPAAKTGAAENTVDVVASNWKFDQESYTAAAGELTVNLTSEEGYHGIAIEGTDLKIDKEGNASTTLETGEYTIICTVPCGEGHEEMTAKLIVE